jgi:hypothetical protein
VFAAEVERFFPMDVGKPFVRLVGLHPAGRVFDLLVCMHLALLNGKK